MTFEPQITFRHMEAVSELEETVHKELAGLERYFTRMTSCHVTLEGPRRHERLGLFDVRIEIDVPGEKLVVKHTPKLQTAKHDPDARVKTKATEAGHGEREAAIAIHQAFHEVRRQLQDYARRLREPAPAPELLEA